MEFDNPASRSIRKQCVSDALLSFAMIFPEGTSHTMRCLRFAFSFLALTVGCSVARGDTTICRAQLSGSSYCSDATPGATPDATASGGYHSLPYWTNLGKTLSSIQVSDNEVWGLDSRGTLWFLANFKATPVTWIKVASGVSQISAGHNLLCQLNRNKHMYCGASPHAAAAKPDAHGFQRVSWFDAGVRDYRQIAVSAGNQIWAVDAKSTLVQIADYTKPASTAIPVAGSVTKVAVDGRGLLCELSSKQTLSCNNWPVPAAAPDATGFYHSLSGWVDTGKSFQRIAVADGKVYGTDASGNVWLMPDYTNSASWEKIADGGKSGVVAAASAPSTFTPALFQAGDVAMLMFMGQSNSSGINPLPARFIAPASPHVWGVKDAGWNGLAGNVNAPTPFAGTVASIASVQWTNWLVGADGKADMNLAFNYGAAGNAANFAAFQWQGLINAGWKLPDLYIVHIGWPSQGVDANDVYAGSAPWTVHGVNLWQPLLTNTSKPSFALAPFARRIVRDALENLLAAGKRPRILTLQWNQWEAEAGNTNPISITNAPTNYKNLFQGFFSAEGNHFPVQMVQPLSTYYSVSVLRTMQSVFANLVKADASDFSIIDVSRVSSTIFGGGVLGGGDGSVHYNLDTQRWFAEQAIGVCLVQGNCGPRITALPTVPTN